jgi:hypothetical protein
VSHTSWIVEVRERLASPPPVALATEGARLAVLVPVYVDDGELWLLLLGPSGEELVPGAATLPAVPIEGEEDPWQPAERCARRIAGDSAILLRLGTLDHVPDPSGDVVIPCVAVVPPPPHDGGSERFGAARVRLPLRAARAPTLLEERRATVRAVETWVTVAHFGPVKLAGVEVEIVELLLDRLFQAGPF